MSECQLQIELPLLQSTFLTNVSGKATKEVLPSTWEKWVHFQPLVSARTIPASCGPLRSSQEICFSICLYLCFYFPLPVTVNLNIFSKNMSSNHQKYSNCTKYLAGQYTTREILTLAVRKRSVSQG